MKTTKTKILFLVQLPPPIHGAALRNQFITKSELINNSFDIKVLPLTFAKDINDLESISVRKILKMFGFLFLLLISLIKFQPDCVYFTLSPVGNSFIRDVIYVALIKTFRINIIYHLRGLGIEQSANKWKMPLYRFVFKNTSVICLSIIATKDIESVYSEKPIIINNGIEDPVTSYGIKLNINREISIKNILFLSNLIKSKGLIDLINAIEILAKSRTDFHINIVGRESNELTLDDINKIITKKKLYKFFTLKKGLYGQDKFVEFIKSDIFVFPTYYPKENFPGVILEAMACQLPIITTKTGSIPEIIENNRNGLLVEINQPEQIATQLHRILENDNLRYRLGVEARKDFLKFYRQEIFEENIFKCFKNLK